jgi:hypothetical protein
LPHETLSEITFDKKGINIFHLNIHYLYPKIDEIKYLVDKYPDIDILGLLETLKVMSLLTQRYL